MQRVKVYELFVLGELTGGPHHGYLLREILGKVLGPFRQVSWGVLYPLIHRLEEEGLIMPNTQRKAHTPKEPGKSGQRNLYAITSTGRARLLELMLDLVPYAAYDPDLFVIKLSYFDFITQDEQCAILQHHRGYLQTHDDHLRTNLQWVMADDDIPQHERARIQWVTEFRLSRIQSEIAWVEAALANVRTRNQ